MQEQNEVAIKITDLHKSFKLASAGPSSLKELFVKKKSAGNKPKKQKVLNGISFNIHKGDFFGIVGKNGSGKSTLLKIIAGVYQPTTGSVGVNGSLTPFIELGVGFNPELSGRDNVYLNGALLGFDRTAMNLLYDDIVEFAELHDAMDKKLKNYSSGMQVRLAFSIAVKAKKDILIFDEVLAVGDEAFQRKCLDVFERYKAEGQTVVLVTHDMETVKNFCNKAVIIEAGKIIEAGNPFKVAETYKTLNQDIIDSESLNDGVKRNRSSHLKAKILTVQDAPSARFSVGDTLRAVVSWDDLKTEDIESIGISIFKKSGEHITGFNTRHDKNLKNWREKKRVSIDIQLNFKPGAYYLLVEAFKEEGVQLDAIFDGPQFSLDEKKKILWSGLMDLPHKWDSK